MHALGSIGKRAGGRLAALSLVIAMLLGSGCGGGGKSYKFNPVKGRVLKEDVPVSGGKIQFTDPSDSNFVAAGTIAGDGTFELETSTTNPARTAKGAPEGTYRVVVSMPPPAPNRPFLSVTAPDSYTVKAGSNDLTIVLP